MSTADIDRGRCVSCRWWNPVDRESQGRAPCTNEIANDDQDPRAGGSHAQPLVTRPRFGCPFWTENGATPQPAAFERCVRTWIEANDTECVRELEEALREEGLL